VNTLLPRSIQKGGGLNAHPLPWPDGYEKPILAIGAKVEIANPMPSL